MDFPASTEARLVIITLIAVAMAWIGLLVWDRYRKRAALTAADPRGLFESLCAAHHLSEGERSVLLRLVATRHIPQPAAVFVDPHHLRDASACEDPPGAACESLLRRLFGSVAGA